MRSTPRPVFLARTVSRGCDERPRIDKGEGGHRLRDSRQPPLAKGKGVRFAGIDIAAEKHFLAVLDEKREVVVKPTAFTEDAAGHVKLLELLGPPGDLLVAMEATGHYCREPRSRCPRSPLSMRERLSRLWIPFEQGTPGEGADLTNEDFASRTTRRPSPGTRLPPSTPEVWHEWGSYKDLTSSC